MDKRQKKKKKRLTGRAGPGLVSFSSSSPPPPLCTQPIPPTPPLLELWDTCCCCCLFAWSPWRAPLPFGSHCLPAASQREALSGRPLITMWRGSEEDVPHRQGGEEGTAFPPQGPGATFHQPNILNPSLAHARTHARERTHTQTRCTHPFTRHSRQGGDAL